MESYFVLEQTGFITVCVLVYSAGSAALNRTVSVTLDVITSANDTASGKHWKRSFSFPLYRAVFSIVIQHCFFYLVAINHPL